MSGIIKRMEVASVIMDGKAIAQTLRDKVKLRVEKLKAQGNRAPGLSVVLVGDNPASLVYVKNKIQACAQAGIKSVLKKLPSESTTDDVLNCINQLNASPEIDGILVQLPLPSHLKTDMVLQAVQPGKDVDGLHPWNLGLLMEGKPGLRPCTPSGVMELLSYYHVELSGACAVVIGRSNLVGKPMALMLLEKHATVTVCHSRSHDLEQICRRADVLVVAAGRESMVRGSWVKPGAAVIDVGINKKTSPDGQSRLVGDVNFPEASKVASLITPVPGGVGPMTIAMLLANTLTAYENRMAPPA